MSEIGSVSVWDWGGVGLIVCLVLLVLVLLALLRSKQWVSGSLTIHSWFAA